MAGTGSEINMIDFIAKYANCSSCTFENNRKVPISIPENPQYELLLIGQNPGETEGITKIPFSGPSGKMLFGLLKAIGMNKLRLYITNLIQCETPGNREPNQQEINCCKERLKQEILFIKPRLIIALGKPALYTLTGKQLDQTVSLGSIYNLLPEWEYDCKVLSQLHPSFVRRTRQWISRSIEVFNYAKLFFENEVKFYNEIAIKHEPGFLIEPSIGQLKDYFNSLKSNEELTYDVETTGLNPREDSLIGIACCRDTNNAMSSSIKENDNEKLMLFKSVLEDKHIGKSAQNGSFDYSFLIPRGIKINPIIWDTRIAEIFINPDMPKDLQTMRAHYTRIPPYKPSKKEMKSIAKWDSNKVNKMGCMDVLTTHEVKQEQKKLMNYKEIYLMNDLFIPLIEVFEYMERQGVLIDSDKAYEYQRNLEPKINTLKNWINKKCGINPGSPKQIINYFNFRDSQEDTLKYHINRSHSQANILQGILKYRQLSKTKGTYIDGILKRMLYGRAHTHYKIEGTGTGRPSSENPNLANVPKEMRVIYKTDSEDYIFIEADYKQLELRTAGLIAPEPKLLKLLAEGIDIHEIMRKELFGGVETGNQRRIAKEVVFGALYGESSRTLAIKWGISIKDATRLQEICINQYPGFLGYKTRNDAIVHRGEPLETPFGMRRTVNTVTQGYNSPNQSTAACVGLIGLRNLYYTGLDIRLTVYDSFLIQTPKKNYLQWAKLVKETLEQPFEIFNSYQFPVDVKVGTNWYNMKKITI